MAWHVPYSATPSSEFESACSLISHESPDIRLKALNCLISASGSSKCTDTNHVDAIFQRLCGIVTTDPVPKLRLEALNALAVLHHASTTIKIQALSKKAIMRIVVQPNRPTAAGPLNANKKRPKQQEQPAQQADGGLFDTATGAFVHGTEDDFPRVRVAAVAAVVSLGNSDQLFADAAAILLSDLTSDEVSEVRVAALQALVAWAAAFHQQKQQQRQQQQQDQSQPGREPGQVDDTADADMQDVEYQEDLEEEEAAASVRDDADVADEISSPAGGAQHDAAAAAAAGPAASGATAAKLQEEQPQQAQPCRRKPRKSDLPVWGKDALLSAVAALTDRDPAVRGLALQLIELLPPPNTPALVTVICGLASRCERFPAELESETRALAAAVAHTRAEMVTLSAGKLVQRLASVLRPEQGALAVATAAAGAAAVNSVGDNKLPAGANLLTDVMLVGVQHRPKGLTALMKELQKANLLAVPALQPWLTQLRDLQQQRHVQWLQQQQEQQEQETGNPLC